MIAYIVVARNSDVNTVKRRVRIAESNDGDVNGAGLAHGLMVSPGIANDKEARFFKARLDLVSESAWGVTSSYGGGAGIMCEFKGSALTGRLTTNNDNVKRVFDGADSAGSKQ